MEFLKLTLQMIFDFFTTPECLFALLPVVLIVLVVYVVTFLTRILKA